MAHLRSHHRAILSLFIMLGGLWPLPARAVISITSANGASGFSLTGTTQATVTVGASNTVTIYGGLAGVGYNTSAVTQSNGLQDTCAGATGLIACNNNAITSGAQLQILFSSTTTDGVPSITYNGQTLTNNSGSASVAHGSVATFTTTWSQICSLMSATDSNLTSGCTLVSPGQTITEPFTATITSTSTTPSGTSGSTTGGTDTGTFNIVITDGLPASFTDPTQPMTIDVCGSTDATDGICHFEMGARDSGVSIKDLSAAGTFPTINTVMIQNLVLLWYPGQNTFQQIVAPSLTDQNHAFVSVVNNGDNSVDLSQSNVSGFTNDQWYSFKIALEDMAGNIAYYTATSASPDTGADYSCDTGTGCHMAEPGVTEGVLANTLTCFIATAAYGSPMAPQVETFRQFRNAFLIPTRWGRRFVRFYYAHSPRYAAYIARHPFLRWLARMALWPVLSFAKLSLKIGALNALCALAASLLLVAFVFSRGRRRGTRA